METTIKDLSAKLIDDIKNYTAEAIEKESGGNRKMKGLVPGRIVHYVPIYPKDVVHAAIVVEVKDAEKGLCRLAIFDPLLGLEFKYSPVPYNESPEPVTWHWIEKN